MLHCLRRGTLLGAAFAAPTMLTPASSLAAANIVYVSSKGNNSNSCTAVSSPCATLQAAQNKVPSGGQIIILDGGSFGPVNITKSVSIVNSGSGIADIQQTTANGYAVYISAPNAQVYLQGLSLDGAGLAGYGVLANNLASLTIVNCTARRFVFHGFSIRTTVNSRFLISNSSASQNGKGFFVQPSAGTTATGVFSNVHAFDNGAYGIWGYGAGAIFTVDGSEIARNQIGVYAYSGATVTVRNSVSSNNAYAGFRAEGAGSILRVARSVAASSSYGFQAISGGVGETYQDNNFADNSPPMAGITSVSPQ